MSAFQFATTALDPRAQRGLRIPRIVIDSGRAASVSITLDPVDDEQPVIPLRTSGWCRQSRRAPSIRRQFAAALTETNLGR